MSTIPPEPVATIRGMDVTPHELRDAEINEVKRGYDCDAVDELLERAADTIEALQHKVDLAEQHARDAEARGVTARESEDVLQRTLLMAQKAADDAIADANARAAAITAAADAQARITIDDAATSAQREATAQRLALESEVRGLAARREALSADVDALERFEADYRARLRRAIEADLDALAVTREPVAASARPAVHDVGSGPAPAGAVSTPAVDPGPPTAALEVVEPAPTGDSLFETAAEPAAPSPPFEETPTDASMSDDDFFASLRDAVNDDTPLGPRDDDLPPDRAMFGDERRSGIFRRRR